MDIEAFITMMKDIHSALLSFIESTEDPDLEYKSLEEVMNNHNVLQNKEGIRLIFQLISKIADNHHRPSDFCDKIEKVIQYLLKNDPVSISDYITDYSNYNKRILFLLLDKGFLKPSQSFLNDYLQNQKNDTFHYYLYPVMKRYINEETQKQIEDQIKSKFEEEDISKFEEKCRTGENDSYLCTLIREDSVEDFISHVTRLNITLSSKIKPSIYETNPYLIGKEVSLIEYASFFGSIQIAQYLKFNNVNFDFSLWFYSIHSNNADLIHFLEDNEIKPRRKEFGVFTNYKSVRPNHESYRVLLGESIKCHHNNIANYFKDNYITRNKLSCAIDSIVSDSLNFYFYPTNIVDVISNRRNENRFNMSKLCFALSSILIPSSVKTIGIECFYECTSLKQIIIPSSVKKIGEYAFYGCSSLEQIDFSSLTLNSIEKCLFFECSSLSKISIPSSVTRINDYAFYGCSSLKQIELPSSVTQIGNNAFDGCSSLGQINLPSSCVSIGNSIFNECSSLIKISIPSSVSVIKYGSFRGCSSLVQIEIPSSVTKIEYGAFTRCSSLKSISFPSSVNEIDECMFFGCSSLMQFEVSSSVTKIGNNAFRGCKSLCQLKMPNSVDSIGDYAFYGCSSLKQIENPFSVRKIGFNAFTNCPFQLN